MKSLDCKNLKEATRMLNACNICTLQTNPLFKVIIESKPLNSYCYVHTVINYYAQQTVDLKCFNILTKTKRTNKITNSFYRTVLYGGRLKILDSVMNLPAHQI